MKRDCLSLSSLLTLSAALLLIPACDPKSGDLGSASDTKNDEGGEEESEASGGSGSGTAGNTDSDGGEEDSDSSGSASGGETEGGGDGTELCGESEYCSEDQYCWSDIGVCDDGKGKCKAVPEVCTEQYEPVCGCDGKTYANDCFAAAEGVSIDYLGECKSEELCGGEVCSDKQFCKFPDGVCKDVNIDTEGKCFDKPEGCDEIYQPVCGCDGKTYGNRCEAESFGVNIAEEGECGDKCLSIKTEKECTAKEGCWPKRLIQTYPNPDKEGALCVSDAYEFVSCIAEQGCGDAETLFCQDGKDEEEIIWWSGDTCSPGPEFADCTQDWEYDFCEGG